MTERGSRCAGPFAPVRVVALVLSCLATTFPATAFAADDGDASRETASQEMLAVLDLVGDGALKEQELQYLTDQIRGEALRHLPRYRIITRENLLEILKANRKTLEECSGDCEVETGRLIGADLVVSGQQIRFGKRLKVSLKLHDTHDARLISVAEAEAPTIDTLDRGVREAAARLFAPLAGDAPAGGGVVVPAPTAPTPAATPTRKERRELAVSVSISSEPSGATVRLNGSDVGTTTWTNFVTPGDAVLELILPHYRTAERKVVFAPDPSGVQRIHLELEPNFGVIQVRSLPHAEVYLDGNRVGVAPWTSGPLNPGPHRVEVRLDRHHPAQQTVTLAVGEERELDLRPAPRTGTLQAVATTPSGDVLDDAEAYLDGQRIGEGPVRKDVLIGERRLEFRDPSGRHLPGSEMVEIEEGGSVQRVVKLREKTSARRQQGKSGGRRYPTRSAVRKSAPEKRAYSMEMSGFFAAGLLGEAGDGDDQDLEPTLGFSGRVFLAMSRYIDLGFLLNAFWWKTEAMDGADQDAHSLIDSAFALRFQIPLAADRMAVYATVPVGLSVSKLNETYAGAEQSAYGFYAGALAGYAITFTRAVGLAVELGWSYHKVDHEIEGVDVGIDFHQLALNLGLVWRF